LDKKPVKQFVNGKGFYVVLSVCFAVVIISAGVITVNNSRQIKQQQEYDDIANNDNTEQEEARDVLNNAVEPMDPNLSELYGLDTAIDDGLSYQEDSTLAVNDTVIGGPLVEKVVAENNVAIAQPIEPEIKQVFSAFKDDSKMIWPLEGKIVMDYSKDHTIYDKTLDQYRINESISIAAQLGTAVTAAATGTVVSIENDNKKGCTVVLDHGNGWQTTYSQLQENVIVDKNEIVEAGDVIGGVGNPTKYGILLGEHLDFEVTKDGVSTDPKRLLAD